MFKFLIGFAFGASLSFAFAQTTTREIDCPPGGKLFMSWSQGGGGAAGNSVYNRNIKRFEDDPGWDYDCIGGGGGNGIGYCTAYKKREP